MYCLIKVRACIIGACTVLVDPNSSTSRIWISPGPVVVGVGGLEHPLLVLPVGGALGLVLVQQLADIAVLRRTPTAARPWPFPAFEVSG